MVLSEEFMAEAQAQICLKKVRLTQELLQRRQSAAPLQQVTQGLSTLSSGYILHAYAWLRLHSLS